MLVSGVIFTRINYPFNEWLELRRTEQDKNRSSARNNFSEIARNIISRQNSTLYSSEISFEEICLKAQTKGIDEGRIWCAAR